MTRRQLLKGALAAAAAAIIPAPNYVSATVPTYATGGILPSAATHIYQISGCMDCLWPSSLTPIEHPQACVWALNQQTYEWRF